MDVRRQRGFTLIELLVVIAIIGILASVVLVSLAQARVKARDSIRVQNLKQVALALEMYALENGGKYPDQIQTCGSLSSDDSRGEECWQCGVDCRYDASALENSVGLFIKPRPCDPSLPNHNSDGGCANRFLGLNGKDQGFFYRVNRNRTEYKITMAQVVENWDNVPVNMQDGGFLPTDPDDKSISISSSENSKYWTRNCGFFPPFPTPGGIISNCMSCDANETTPSCGP